MQYDAPNVGRLGWWGGHGGGYEGRGGEGRGKEGWGSGREGKELSSHMSRTRL